MFDAIISNPDARRDTLQTDSSWQCPGIRWMARRDDAHRVWWGALALPWVSLTRDGKIPPACRANFYRIERPHDGAVEYSCWAPTFTAPADFHKPARFGFLEFAAA